MAKDVPPPAALSSGFQSTYQLFECLGAGAAGTVFRAKHSRLNRLVALKLLKVQAGTNAAKRFDEEARTLAMLSHPRIPKIYDYGWDSEVPYIAMEFIGGGSLRNQMVERGVYAPAAAVAVALSLLDGLAYVHAQGLLHRDIKPENVLIDADGGLFLADFGLAFSTFEERTQLTELGHMVGTVRYMSPELFGLGTYSETSDVYAVGVVLYELLTGQSPYRSANMSDMIAVKLKGEEPRVRSIVPDVPEALDELVAKAISKFPEDRPASAAAYADALKKSLRGPRSRPLAAVAPAPASARRAPWAALSVAVLVAGMGAFAMRRPPGPPPAATPAPSLAPSASSAPGQPQMQPFHERAGVPPLKLAEARLYWREIHAWLIGMRADAPRRKPDPRAGRLETEIAWRTIGDGRVLKSTGLSCLLDWIYQHGDDAHGWFTLARQLQSEGQPAAAERVMRHALTLLAGPPYPDPWCAGGCEALVSALMLDGRFDEPRWRELEARLPLGAKGVQALVGVLTVVEPAVVERMLFERAKGKHRVAAARAFVEHLDARSGDLVRVRTIWSALLASPDRPLEVQEAVFMDRIARGDADAARAVMPDAKDARELFAAVAGEDPGLLPIARGLMGVRARGAWLVRQLEARNLDAVEKLAGTLAGRALDDRRERDTRVVALAALTEAGRPKASADLALELDAGPISAAAWSELAGPWDAGDGHVSRLLAERSTGPAGVTCVLARAVAESRRGRHAEAHALLQRALELRRDEAPVAELELEVLARPFLEKTAWTPPAWSATHVPFSMRGGAYARRVGEFLTAVRAGDSAGADRLARAQADEVPWAPVWALARRKDDESAGVWRVQLSRACRFAGCRVRTELVRGAP